MNRVSNKLYNDNQPTPDYPNDPFWFGRTGTQRKMVNGSKPAMINGQSNEQSGDIVYQDVRRRKLLDALENRGPKPNGFINPNMNGNMSNNNQMPQIAPSQYAFANSSNPNMYDSQLRMN